MKTIIKLFIIFLFAFGGRVNGQITFMKSYPYYSINDGYFESVYLKHSGFKFVYLHHDTLSFYNMNLSLYRNAIIPGSFSNIACISEGLFDTDTLHIDYVATDGCCQMAIYKDNGATVFSKDSAAFVQRFPGMQSPIFFPIVPTDSGTYMILTQHDNNGNIASLLYKLPGSLPCVPGCMGNIDLGVAPLNNNTNNMMNVYPNPAVSYTNIYYTLPQGTTQGQLTLYDLGGRVIKQYIITSAFDHLRLTTSDIAAGTYFYQLSVNGNAIASKKIIVVK